MIFPCIFTCISEKDDAYAAETEVEEEADEEPEPEEELDLRDQFDDPAPFTESEEAKVSSG